MGVFLDVVVLVVALAIPALVTLGMLSKAFTPSPMPASIWFTWHPILMSLAFPCLMTLGRWTYMMDPSWGMEKQSIRHLHRALMLAAVGILLVAYLCIFMSHLPGLMFFGYNFKTREWKPWARIAHVWFGYAAVVLTIAQAFMGMLKLAALQETGVRRFTFHGSLGKGIIILASLSFFAALRFWGGWGLGLKLVLAMLAAFVAIYSSAWPKPIDNKCDEETARLAAEVQVTQR
mmetsp:Transcript_132517/g.258142  ORF Transcript_132517/g.258142 Transcript_132517/m.258142 type:complete len:233 (-) Transcript_132517:489-1187(-)